MTITPTASHTTRRRRALPRGLARLVATVVSLVAAVVFVVGTIGPPLFGQGVFLTSDLLYLAFPWQAHADPSTLNAGHGGPTTDTIDVVYPSRAVFGNAARHGDFLSWNPSNFGGEPLGATSNFGQLNPLAWPFVLAPGWLAPALVKLAGLVTALVFTYLFCRRLGTDRVPAVLGGIVYAGSGFIVMWTNWPQADVASLLPALFWATERFLQKRTLSSAVPIAVALALALIAMFPAVVGYALTVLAGYVVIRLACGYSWRAPDLDLPNLPFLRRRGPADPTPVEPVVAPAMATPAPRPQPVPLAMAPGLPTGAILSRDPSGRDDGVETVTVIAPDATPPPVEAAEPAEAAEAAEPTESVTTPEPPVEPAAAEPAATAEPVDPPATADVPPEPPSVPAPAAPTKRGPAHLAPGGGTDLGALARVRARRREVPEGRLSLGQTLWAGLGTVLALGAGVALVAAILLPFGARLGSSELEREQTSKSYLGVPTLITTVAPSALGLSTEGVVFAGPRNQIEGVAYVGVVALVLAVAALALPRVRRGPPGAVAGLAVMTGLLGVATFGGGPILEWLQNFPVYDTNYIGRARSILGFTVAALAAVGLQALLERGAAERARRLGLLGIVRFVVVAGLATWLAVWVYGRSQEEAQLVDRAASFADAVSTAEVFGWLTLAGVALLLIGRGPGRQVLAAALVVVATVQGMMLSVPLLPNEDEATLYPDLPGLRYLRENTGGERVVPEALTLFGNATMMEGVRSVTGHGFHSPAWKEMLLTASPGAFGGSPTLGSLSGEASSVASPIYDRMGARWFAGVPWRDPFGTRETLTLDRADCTTAANPGVVTASPAMSYGLWSFPYAYQGEVSGGTVIGRVRAPAGDGLHGVVVRLCNEAELPQGTSFLVTARAGDLTASGTFPVRGNVSFRDFALPVPAGNFTGVPIDVTIAIRTPDEQDLRFAAGPGGGISADLIRPGDDGLRLAFAGDIRVYERTRALPRIHWASRSVVIRDSDDRVDYIAAGGVAADTVVLEAGDPGGSGLPGQVEVLEDDQSVRVSVDAQGDGYLVIADSFQTDWVATVDGRPAELLDADHSGVAVAVPAGRHVVGVTYEPRGQQAGIRITVVTAVLLAVVAAASLARQLVLRRRAARPAAAPVAEPPPPAAEPPAADPFEGVTILHPPVPGPAEPPIPPPPVLTPPPAPPAAEKPAPDTGPPEEQAVSEGPEAVPDAGAHEEPEPPAADAPAAGANGHAPDTHSGNGSGSDDRDSEAGTGQPEAESPR